ncbi:MAG: sigma-54 dependent transcriptional regulator [candidate division KSB1 bacterium]|nr:sigma-54 dependent transcriptional regulator [candidate division KSB1 bacterium]MDZ7333621.1 sigma-54 dependent transcriptional regulator [candidate division KSB1 bacterium]MDZ7357807.1 sigma-54 dependent transcriptional regulator [candidate division KSB1 bacterium]MDZ7398735.1 sigma-54 dependent transcriptional regulator [candidate division KSB1 bacterium]
MNGNILIIDNEKRMCGVLKAALEMDQHQVEVAYDGETGLSKFKRGEFDVVITDLKMPGKDGIAVLEEVKKLSPDTEVILMTAYATAQTAVEAMRKGAYDYLIKPFEMVEMKLKVKQILEKKQLAIENLDLKSKLRDKYSLRNIVGQSEAMQQVYRMVEKVAPRDATVLIRGESGTGKELIAQAIHQLSPRAERAFIAVNCAALPETLLESELFGHEKGAFTGAEKQKRGRFELAAGGTIFLDEIGDISPATQAKLLRVLQNKEINRLGGEETISVDVRTIAATNRNLEELIKQGQFREDLYYRLNVFPIVLPPLRDRREDIPDLVMHFLKKYNQPADKILPSTMKALMNYHWPGNIRELENIIERMIILAGDDPISPELLPPQIKGYLDVQDSPLIHIPDTGLSIDAVEKQLIQQALKKASGNKSKAAKLLGITRRRLYSMMERLNRL